jgi:hypothetical protein
VRRTSRSPLPLRSVLPSLPLLLALMPAHGTVDTDGDRMHDAFELRYGLDPADPDQNGNGVLDGQEDIDGDGLGNAAEALADTHPAVPDTDGDGLSDAEELAPPGLSPPLAPGGRSAGAKTVVVLDVDRDGDQDFLLGESFPGSLHYYENTDGAGAFDRHLVSADAPGVFAIAAADLDGDGDADLVSTGSSATSGEVHLDWYENVGGPGAFGAPSPIAATLHTPRSVRGVDMDGDGDLDLLLGDFVEGTRWLPNTDGQGTFGAERTIAPGASAAAVAADLDGDGDPDVADVGKSATSTVNDQVVWRRNLNAPLSLWSAPIVLVTEPSTVRCVDVADLDGDGDTDVLFSSNSHFGWFENTNGLGTFAAASILPATTGGLIEQVLPADMDGDGDLDLLLLAGTGLWVSPNTDGTGTLGPPLQLASEVSANTSTNPMDLGDLDGSGEADVVVAGNSAVGPPVYVLRARRTASPLLTDSDGDGLDDPDELAQGRDPLVPDAPARLVPALTLPAALTLAFAFLVSGGRMARRA